ncbi:uncharacterized protein LOC135287377 [Passer domesticus]|uniref:uncharacterized protein LOC135287377 n=1 Tax=Passer domesticus TaxID=48849 RepID=UPI0030FF371C
MVGTWGGHEGGYGDVQGEQDMVVGHEEGTGRWWWGRGDGQDHLEMVKGAQEGRERGQGGAGPWTMKMTTEETHEQRTGFRWFLAMNLGVFPRRTMGTEILSTISQCVSESGVSLSIIRGHWGTKGGTPGAHQPPLATKPTSMATKSNSHHPNVYGHRLPTHGHQTHVQHSHGHQLPSPTGHQTSWPPALWPPTPLLPTNLSMATTPIPIATKSPWPQDSYLDAHHTHDDHPEGHQPSLHGHHLGGHQPHGCQPHGHHPGGHHAPCPSCVPLLPSYRQGVDGEDDKEQNMERQMQPISQMFIQGGIQASDWFSVRLWGTWGHWGITMRKDIGRSSWRGDMVGTEHGGHQPEVYPGQQQVGRNIWGMKGSLWRGQGDEGHHEDTGRHRVWTQGTWWLETGPGLVLQEAEGYIRDIWRSPWG